MKKVSYNLNFGLINFDDSTKGSKNKIFMDYLNKTAIRSNRKIESRIEQEYFEFLIIFEDIPIKIQLFTASNLREIIYNYDQIKHLDVVILIFNYSSPHALNVLKSKEFNEFKSIFAFQGISMLAGIVSENEKSKEEIELIRSNLIEKAKELNIIYGYEINKHNRNISGLFEKILKDFIFKFEYTSPELYDLAKLYGKKLTEK